MNPNLTVTHATASRVTPSIKWGNGALTFGAFAGVCNGDAFDLPETTLTIDPRDEAHCVMVYLAKDPETDSIDWWASHFNTADGNPPGPEAGGLKTCAIVAILAFEPTAADPAQFNAFHIAPPPAPKEADNG